MRVKVEQVSWPVGSTLGYGIGRTDDGTVEVLFAGDWRQMVELGDAMVASGEAIEVSVEDWQVLAVREVAPESPTE